MQLAKTLPKDHDVVIVSPLQHGKDHVTNSHPQCLSGRGDKDVEQISQLLPGKWADILDWHV